MTQKQLVIGLGESGVAMVRYATRSSTPVSVYDSRQSPAALPAFTQRYPDVTVHCGDFSADYLDGVSEVLLSPGLSPHAEPLKTIIEQANARGIAVLGELAVFSRALSELHAHNGYNGYKPKVLAVTGTNGKTTVTSLTRHLCEAAGVSVLAAGNISPSMLDALCGALEQDALPQVWVLELSSFQLQFAQSNAIGFNPDAATVLNLSQDHLDWHVDMVEYTQAKAQVFGADTVQVLNRDDAAVNAMAKPNSRVLSFGVSVPTAVGQYGLWREGNHSAATMEWLSVAVADSSVSNDCIATPVPCHACAMVSASLPIKHTKRTCAFTASVIGVKSCPLPSPPAINTIGCPNPSIAANVAPTFVPLESS